MSIHRRGRSPALRRTAQAIRRPRDRVSTALKPAQVRQALRRLDENSITYVALARNGLLYVDSSQILNCFAPIFSE